MPLPTATSLSLKVVEKIVKMVQRTTTIAAAAAALVLVLVAMAEASAYKPIMAITETKDPSESEQCDQQIQSQQLQQCLEYLMHGNRQMEELPVLLLLLKGSSNPQVLQQCCQKLEQIKIKCRCNAIKKMLQDQEAKLEKQKMQAIARRATNLPAMCSLEPHRCVF